jgi:hypothetical protein
VENHVALFVPSSQLLIAADDSKTAQKFVLSSNGWFDLQTRLQSVLALPYNYGEYELRYGGASSGLQMKECFDAMNRLQGVARRYGNPKQLRAKFLQDPNFLANVDRPKSDAYAATVWTLERAHQNGFSLASALKSIPSSAPGAPASEVVTGIKSLFFDTDQIADRMQQTVTQLNALISEFRAMSDELDDAQAAMRIYTSSSSTTQKALNQEIGGLQAKIAELEKERDAAYSEWLGLTISACLVPAVIGIVGIAIMVVLAVPTGGASFAVGTAVTGAAAGIAAAGLGTAAGLARSAYDDLVKQVTATSDFTQKRVTYRHDLGALDTWMKFSLPAASEIVNQVTVVRDAWVSSLQEIKYKVGELDVNNLASGPWLRDAEMAASAANWIKVDDAMRAFVGGTFIDSDVMQFGSALPKDDPDWQKQLLQKMAA